jgi:predicted unusual protein kinase regulating ubiquinone biosynthesis (AarF/ABC1/UbiB family)
MIVLEGVARDMDPEINIIANTLPYIVSNRIKELTKI